jgi:putative tricarboxylic transport membrane protein
MSVSRRELLLSAATIAAIANGQHAFAQADWKPTRDVEFVIPFAVGGGSDLMARALHKIMTEEKLVPVSVALVNRPGGGGAVGIGYVAASRKADPHTLVLVNGSTQITPILTPNAKTLTEVQPVMNVMLDDFILFVKADAPWKTAADFVNDAKSKPPKTFAFSTGGTTDVMAITILAKATGTELNTVNFNSGGEALTALLGGHVQASIGNPLEFMGHLNKPNGVRAIGVFRDTRFAELPDVPTMKEQGINAPNFQMWRGVAMPKGAPEPAVRYWQGIMEKVVASPQYKAYLKDNVGSEAPIAGQAFEKFLADQERLYRDLLGK